jgi:quinol monooxygenase YgiN
LGSETELAAQWGFVRDRRTLAPRRWGSDGPLRDLCSGAGQCGCRGDLLVGVDQDSLLDRPDATAVASRAISRFAQHAQVHARAGQRDELAAKFVEACEMQRDNPACELMLVSTSPDDLDSVFLTEVWTSAEDHERARQSSAVQAWAEQMPSLVAGPPEVTALVIEGTKGLAAE